MVREHHAHILAPVIDSSNEPTGSEDTFSNGLLGVSETTNSTLMNFISKNKTTVQSYKFY